MKDILMVGMGGFAGSILRYKIGALITSKVSSGFPWGTFCVNLTGAFLIGFLIASALKSQEMMMLLLITGFCGGFTTFSTFALENLRLLQNGDWMLLLAYILLSLVCGIGLCFVGYLLGNLVNS